MRKNSQHIKDLKKMSIKEIDLIVVNFYPFEEIINNTKNEKKLLKILI